MKKILRIRIIIRILVKSVIEKRNLNIPYLTGTKLLIKLQTIIL